jgi:transglutaminase-like putative cysteine protease
VRRRRFLRSAGAAAAGLAWPGSARALSPLWPGPAEPWRSFEVTTSVAILKPAGVTRVWLPLPLLTETPYQRPLGNTFQADGGTALATEDAASGAGILRAEWPDGVKPVLTLTSRVATRNHGVDLAKPSPAAGKDRRGVERFLKPSALIPTDGIVKATALEATRGAKGDLDKARAIYEWVVANTFRDPKVRGCGRGDIRSLLESKNLGGKCADLNALYVGLARAAGLPARDVYGLRVAKSALGLKSLGASSEDVTKAQHCRAEVYLAGFGWVPVDPADVRKVVLEEPPAPRTLDDDVVRQTRARLFGSWEMNWMGYNDAHDVVLPGASRPALGFFMYPHCETADGRLDHLDADGFRYRITAREVA